MTYKERITEAMAMLASDPRRRFVGYGLKHGRAGGTIPKECAGMICETPVAENLMTGIAVGQSLAGLMPLVYFERFDFVLNAADCIVNHLAAARHISGDRFRPAVILRVVVGNSRKPLFTGRTHTQDFSLAFRSLVDFPVVRLAEERNIMAVYEAARDHQWRGESSMIVEFKDLL